MASSILSPCDLEYSKFTDDKISSQVARGLARMEDHLEADDGIVEEYAADFLNCSHALEFLEALEEDNADREYLLAAFAARMFLAGKLSRNGHHWLPAQPE
jgi:hypothetical protein